MQIEITPEYLHSQGLSATFPKRFWAKVSKTDSCWLWTAATDHNGYGVIMSKYKRTGNAMISAHRGSWLLHFGPIPPDADILHHCDQPLCIRPDHLFEGNQFANVTDMINKDRMPRGEQRAHAKLTTEQVIELRSLYFRGGTTYKSLAEWLGMSPATIGQIIRFEKWKHVEFLLDHPGE